MLPPFVTPRLLCRHNIRGIRVMCYGPSHLWYYYACDVVLCSYLPNMATFLGILSCRFVRKVIACNWSVTTLLYGYTCILITPSRRPTHTQQPALTRAYSLGYYQKRTLRPWCTIRNIHPGELHETIHQGVLPQTYTLVYYCKHTPWCTARNIHPSVLPEIYTLVHPGVLPETSTLVYYQKHTPWCHRFKGITLRLEVGLRHPLSDSSQILIHGIQNFVESLLNNYGLVFM